MGIRSPILSLLSEVRPPSWVSRSLRSLRGRPAADGGHPAAGGGRGRGEGDEFLLTLILGLGHLFGLLWRGISFSFVLVTYSELRRFDKMADVGVDAFILLLLTVKKDAGLRPSGRGRGIPCRRRGLKIRGSRVRY